MTMLRAVYGLILRIVVLRFLLVAHPSADLGGEALAAWLVRLVYGIARVADHDLEVHAFLGRDAEQHLDSLADIRALLPLL